MDSLLIADPEIWFLILFPLTAYNEILKHSLEASIGLVYGKWMCWPAESPQFNWCFHTRQATQKKKTKKRHSFPIPSIPSVCRA